MECHNLNVPIELNLQEQASRMESCQQWTVKEVIEGKNRHDEVTKHAADAFEELRNDAKAIAEQLRVELANSACPCPPGCKGKVADEPDVAAFLLGANTDGKAAASTAATCGKACNRGLDPWHAYPAGRPGDATGDGAPQGKGKHGGPDGPSGGGDGDGGDGGPSSPLSFHMFTEPDGDPTDRRANGSWITMTSTPL